ncbi:MAG: hypothetical protein JWO52_5649 [Gammaproteobacteria bacterium]|nr:hypothetical protein [Gammaproteobacteria bacterium]
MEHEVETLIARLNARQFLPRTDTLVKRALTDEAFYNELSRRLSACGLELIDHPFADHVALRLRRDLEQPVFGGETWLSNNLGLQRDQVALLVVLWALLILPKRSRQLTRQNEEIDQSQGEMFTATKPLPSAEQVNISVAEATLLADFGDRLGGKTRINIGLGVLSRLSFIVRRAGHVYEGPLLDLALDYQRMAPRILNGALQDLLAKQVPRVPEKARDV